MPSEVLKKLASSSFLAAIIALELCVGCGVSDQKVEQVEKKSESYFFEVEPGAKREYDEVHKNFYVTMRTGGIFQEMFSGAWKVPLLITSKRNIASITLKYYSGRRQLIRDVVMKYYLGQHHWNNAQVEIPFFNGTNNMELEILDEDLHLIAKFEITDFVEKLIKWGLLPDSSRELYLNNSPDPL